MRDDHRFSLRGITAGIAAAVLVLSCGGFPRTAGTPAALTTAPVETDVSLTRPPTAVPSPITASTPTRPPTRTPPVQTPLLTAQLTLLPSQSSLVCPGLPPAWITGFQVFQPPQLDEPAVRQPFRDPTFGSCLVRVSDRTADLGPGDTSEGFKNEYSRIQAFNANQTRLLARGTDATWYLYDANTLQPLGKLPFEGSLNPRWDAHDPDILYYSEDTRLMSYRLSTKETRTVHDFIDDFPGMSVEIVSTSYEGSPSLNGRYWGFVILNQDWKPAVMLVYDQQEDQVTATRPLLPGTPAIDYVTISPLGDLFIAGLDACSEGLGTDEAPCGVMAYDRSLQNGRGLVRTTSHSDLALTESGRQVMVYQDTDTDQISMLDLLQGTVTPLWAIDFSHMPIGFHFSGRAFNRPGWAVVSTYDGDAASHTWMDDQVFAIELKSHGRVVRLAHTHSIVDEKQDHDYWAEPQATVDRYFTRVLFTSNWGRSGTEQVEMYEILVDSLWSSVK